MITLPVYGSATTPVVNADTNASANTIVLRDGSGNTASKQQTQDTLVTNKTIIAPVPVNKAASFTAALDTDFYLCDATSGAIVATLPPVASCPGREYEFKKIDSGGNAVTVTGNSTDVIDGSNTKALSSQYAKVRVRSDGTVWWIVV